MEIRVEQHLTSDGMIAGEPATIGEIDFDA